jgi:hypothetical protein
LVNVLRFALHLIDHIFSVPTSTVYLRAIVQWKFK